MKKVLRLISSVETGAAQPSYVSITELVNGWVAEKLPAKKTIYEWTRVLRELEAYLGHATLITPTDSNNWKAEVVSRRR